MVDMATRVETVVSALEYRRDELVNRLQRTHSIYTAKGELRKSMLVELSQVVETLEFYSTPDRLTSWQHNEAKELIAAEPLVS